MLLCAVLHCRLLVHSSFSVLNNHSIRLFAYSDVLPLGSKFSSPRSYLAHSNPLWILPGNSLVDPAMSASSIMVEHLRVVPLSIRQYISREQLWASQFDSQRTTMDLNRAMAAMIEYGMDLSAVFWASQTKAKQLHYCASYGGETDFSQMCFCAKCGHWVDTTAMPEHLAIQQLFQTGIVNPAELWKVPDATEICLAMRRLPHSHIRDQSGRLAALRQADWPEICPWCHLLVMHSCMTAHKSSRLFCKHARLTKLLSRGLLMIDRFTWYPGHPLLHFYKVGKWNVLTLVLLHSLEVKAIQAALFPLLIAIGLHIKNVKGPPVDTILCFLLESPFGTRWPFLNYVLNTISGDATMWVYRRSIRELMRRFESNLLVEDNYAPTTSIPLCELPLPHEIPVPEDGIDEGNGTFAGTGQSSSSSSQLEPERQPLYMFLQNGPFPPIPVQGPLNQSPFANQWQQTSNDNVDAGDASERQ